MTKKSDISYTIDNTFMDIDGYKKNFSIHCIYNQRLYKNYQYKIIGDEHYLIASNPYKNEGNKTFIFSNWESLNTAIIENTATKIRCKNAEILISLLKLRNKIKDYGYDYTNAQCRQIIIKWCKKYGLPFVGKPLTMYDSSLEDNNYLWSNYNLIGFSLEKFIEHVNILYEQFLFYISVRENNIQEEIKGFTIYECKHLLRFAFSQIKSEVLFDFNKFAMAVQFNNIFQLASYELALTASTSQDKDIGICLCCNSPFERTRKNQKYCPNCSPQKAYKRRASKTKPSKEAKR